MVSGFILVSYCRYLLRLFAVVQSCVGCLCTLCLEVWVIILTYIVWIAHVHLTDFFVLKQCLRPDYFHLIRQCSVVLIVSSF